MSIETWLLDKSKYPSSKCGHMSKYGRAIGGLWALDDYWYSSRGYSISNKIVYGTNEKYLLILSLFKSLILTL